MHRIAITAFAALILAACSNQQSDVPEAPKPEPKQGAATAEMHSGVPITDQILYDVLVQTSPEEETVDWRLTNVDNSVRDGYVKALFDGIATGTITAYAHPLGLPTKDKAHILTPAALHNLLNDTTTQFVENMDTGELIETEIIVNTPPEEVYRFEFVEKWSYDPTTLQIYKEVVGLACLIPVFGEPDGGFRGNKRLFWVWFDESPLLDFPA